jgi:hypothetical protein
VVHNLGHSLENCFAILDSHLFRCTTVWHVLDPPAHLIAASVGAEQSYIDGEFPHWVDMGGHGHHVASTDVNIRVYLTSEHETN